VFNIQNVAEASNFGDVGRSKITPMPTNFKSILSVLIALLITQKTIAQDVLEDYVKRGLSNNLVLKERNISLEKSLLALKEAKTLFMPSVNLSANYTVAAGGRVIEFPIGDLLNGAYSTLNRLTASQNFPQLENQKILLAPNNFYDVKLRTTYPIFNTDIKHNQAIKSKEIALYEADIKIYENELASDIRKAYFNYCTAVEAKQIYASAAGLVAQNLKVNQSLVNNGKGLIANVLRAESEVENVSAKSVEAENQRLNAKAYFNFLINEKLTDTVIYGPLSIFGISELGFRKDAPIDISNRVELRKIGAAIEVNKAVLDFNKDYKKPKIGSFLDLGLQNNVPKFNAQTPYLLLGLQLELPIYNGGREPLKIQQTQLNLQALDIQRNQVEKQLTLAATVAQNNLQTEIALYQSATKKVTALRSYFKLVERGFKEGTNPFIEFIDARNQLTVSELQVSIQMYKILAAKVELERIIGGK
jgi:outer membrane protein